MGAGGRNWQLLKRKFRVSACAGVDKSRIQDAARKEPEDDELSVRENEESWDEEDDDSSETQLTVLAGDLSLEAPVKGNWSGTVTKEELGRSTWTFLHTLAAQFPIRPTKQQQRDVKELMAIISRLYPCKTCAEHFKEILKTNPPKAKSGLDLVQWMCQVHNLVNKSLGKSQFPCEQAELRWGTFNCDGACDLHSRP
jgi:FAD-linked sulfhydryl oxidase